MQNNIPNQINGEGYGTQSGTANPQNINSSMLNGSTSTIQNTNNNSSINNPSSSQGIPLSQTSSSILYPYSNTPRITESKTDNFYETITLIICLIILLVIGMVFGFWIKNKHNNKQRKITAAKLSIKKTPTKLKVTKNNLEKTPKLKYNKKHKKINKK